MIGRDLDDERRQNFRVSRIRSDIRFATRRERDFRLPEDFDIEEYRGRAEWQFGDVVGEARIEVAPDTAWWVERVYAAAATASRATSSSPSTPSLAAARALDPAPGRAAPSRSTRRSCATLVVDGVRARARDAHEGGRRAPAAERRSRRPRRRAERAVGPGRARAVRRPPVAARVPARRLRRRARGRRSPRASSSSGSRSRAEALEEHLSLLNLVNFGGGCYAVYAELRGDEVHVDKELFGDTFRRAAAADAARGARDPARARVRRPDDRRRRPLAARPRAAQARGDVRRSSTSRRRRAAARPAPRRSSSATLTRAIDEHRLVELEYLKPDETRGLDADGRAVLDRAPAAALVRPHVGSRRATSARSYRLDRMRKAKLLTRRSHAARGVRPGRAPRCDDRARSGTRRPSRAGRSRRARGRSSTAARSASAPSAAPSGSSARSSRSAARRRARAGRPARAGRGAGRASSQRAAAPRTRSRAGRSAASGSVERERRARARRASRRSSVPPCASAIERAMKRPRPVPGFARLRARGRTSRRSARWSSGAMPGPGRAPSTSTPPFDRRRAHLDRARRAGEYLTALSIRFESTCRSRSRVAADRAAAARGLRATGTSSWPTRRPRPRRRTSAPTSTSPKLYVNVPGLDARGVEHVADERREPGRLVGDQGEERLALLGRQLAPALLQRPGRADHRRHRAPQLVRDERHEVGAQRRQPAQLLDRCAARPRRRGCSAPRSRRAGRAA